MTVFSQIQSLLHFIYNITYYPSIKSMIKRLSLFDELIVHLYVVCLNYWT